MDPYHRSQNLRTENERSCFKGKGQREVTGFEGAHESSTFECPASAVMVTGTPGICSSCLPVWEFLCTFIMVKIVRIPKIFLKPNCGLCQMVSLRKNHTVSTMFALYFFSN